MSGVHQFKTDFADPAGSAIASDGVAYLEPGFYGGVYAGDADPEVTVNRYVQITEVDGVKTLTLKLNGLGGVNNTEDGGYTLADNIAAFEAAFLTPLSITRVNTSTAPQVTPANTLYISYEFFNDESTTNADTFYVKIMNINNYDRLMNVSRVVRAILNNKRDNNFIAGMIMLAMLRDDADHQFSAQSFPVGASFNGPSTSPMATNYGPVVPTSVSLGNDNPHVGFTWPTDIIDPTTATASEDGLAWFTLNVKERILNTLGFDITAYSWINLGAHPSSTESEAYLAITFSIEDEPARATTAIAIIDTLRSGIFGYPELLRGIRGNNGGDDLNIQRGIFPHLSDTILARDDGSIDAVNNPWPLTNGTQNTLWSTRGW